MIDKLGIFHLLSAEARGVPGNSLGQLSTAHDIAVTQNGDIMITYLDGRVQLFSLE